MQQHLFCYYCGHEFTQEMQPSGQECQPVTCPNCGEGFYHPWNDSEPLHIVVSTFNGRTMYKPSRPTTAWRMRALLEDALHDLRDCGYMSVLDPAVCKLQAFVTVVTDSQISKGESDESAV